MREKFEQFFQRMPKVWTDIQVLALEAKIPPKKLAAYLREKRTEGLVEYRLVRKKRSGTWTTSGEWRKL